jgi:hypothetical protein
MLEDVGDHDHVVSPLSLPQEVAARCHSVEIELNNVIQDLGGDRNRLRLLLDAVHRSRSVVVKQTLPQPPGAAADVEHAPITWGHERSNFRPIVFEVSLEYHT